MTSGSAGGHDFINSTETLEEILTALCQQPHIDAVVFLMSVMYKAEGSIMRAIWEAKEKAHKPILVIWQAGPEGLIRRFRANQITTFEDPIRAIRIIGEYLYGPKKYAIGRLPRRNVLGWVYGIEKTDRFRVKFLKA